MRWLQILRAALRTPQYAVQVMDDETGDYLTVDTYFTAEAAEEAVAEFSRGGQPAYWVKREKGASPWRAALGR